MKAVHSETKFLFSETVHGDTSLSIVRGCLCQHNLEASTLGIAVEMPDCCRIKCCGDRKRDKEKTNKNRAKNKTVKDLTNRSSSTSIFQVGYLIQFTNFFSQKISSVLLLIELQVLEIPVSKNLHVLVWVTATVNIPDMKWLMLVTFFSNFKRLTKKTLLKQDLNPRPLDYHTSALPSELFSPYGGPP